MALSEPEYRAIVAAHVHRLISTPEWEMFLEELQGIERRTLEALATTPPTEVPFQQGLLKGIREVMKLPERLMALGRKAA